MSEIDRISANGKQYCIYWEVCFQEVVYVGIYQTMGVKMDVEHTQKRNIQLIKIHMLLIKFVVHMNIELNANEEIELIENID